jgi:hypothetical protein
VYLPLIVNKFIIDGSGHKKQIKSKAIPQHTMEAQGVEEA